MLDLSPLGIYNVIDKNNLGGCMKINTRLITVFMAENNLNITEFCKLCGICYGSFKKIMSGELNYLYKALFSIAQVMNVNMFDLIIDE